MLPGTPGNRGFPDQPDIVLVIGWDKGAPPPQPDAPGVKLMVLEHCFAHDFFLSAKRNAKRNKYVTLVNHLRQAGWSVTCDERASAEWYDDAEEGEIPPQPVHTFVQGHRGAFAKYDDQTLRAFGVDSTDVCKLLRTLYRIAATGLHTCVVTHHRACKLAPRAATPPRAGMG